MISPRKKTSINSPSSPSRYYSAPSSPTPSLGYDCETKENGNSNLNEFEFNTSERFRYQQVELVGSQSLRYPLDDKPIMSFADELFRNGLLMPIKPPPIPQNEGGYLSSTTASPRSPSSILKNHFRRHSKWDDEFDPFVVALESVRDEKRSGKGEVPTRRASSLSPFNTRLNENEPKKKLAKPIGNDSVFGRRLGNEITKYKKDPRKSGKGFLFKCASFGREKTQEKTREQTSALWIKSPLGKFSFKMKGI